MADVEQQDPGPEHREADYVHLGREFVEAARHHEVREPVIDDEHLDTALGGVDERGLEPVTDLIVFPDEGLEEHATLGGLDSRDHVGKEVFTVGINHGLVLAHGAVQRIEVGEGVAARPRTLPDRVDEDKRPGDGGLKAGHDECDPECEAARSAQWGQFSHVVNVSVKRNRRGKTSKFHVTQRVRRGGVAPRTRDLA